MNSSLISQKTVSDYTERLDFCGFISLLEFFEYIMNRFFFATLLLSRSNTTSYLSTIWKKIWTTYPSPSFESVVWCTLIQHSNRVQIPIGDISENRDMYPFNNFLVLHLLKVTWHDFFLYVYFKKCTTGVFLNLTINRVDLFLKHIFGTVLKSVDVWYLCLEKTIRHLSNFWVS